MINGIVVKFPRGIPNLRFDVDGIPELQPLFECITASLHRIELLAVLNRGTQLVLDLRLRSAKHIFRDHLPVCIVSSGVPAFPASVFPLANIPFAVGSSFRHRVYLLLILSAHTITTSTAE